MKQFLTIACCVTAFFFTACKKEVSDNFNTYPDHPLNDTVWAKNVSSSAAVYDLYKSLALPVIVDSFNIATGAKLNYGDSLEIEFGPSSFFGPGGSGVLTGFARLEITPIKRKGDFIRVFRPTTTANGSILETGGGLLVRCFKDVQELALTGNSTVEIKFNDVDTPKTNMQLFYGKETTPFPPVMGIDTAFFWIRDFDTTYLETWVKNSNNPLIPSYAGYKVKSKNLRWIAAEKYIDSTQAKTKVNVILSPNFTNKNTAVFAVFNNQKTVVNLKADYASRAFNASNIPVKTSLKLVSISKIGGDYYLGVTNVSSVTSSPIYNIAPAIRSLKDIITYLNSL
ncbi:MAG: hypothetical protein RLZZ28_983 [Bacteroidota bacterium]